MSNITPTIVEEYYLDKFSQLSKEKQFHFVSRLFLFSNKKKYQKEIKNLYSYYVWSEADANSIIDEELSKSKEHIKKIINNRPYREEYVQKYPLLGSFNHILFKILFQKSVYDKNYLETLKFHPSSGEMEKYFNSLLKDTSAIFNLSTHAINFIFIYKHFFQKNISIEEIAQIAQEESLENTDDTLQASIYLLTHIIICESLFYSKEIVANYEKCVTILEEVENAMKKDFENISLDQKLEFLICNKLLKKASSLETKILSEAQKSKSNKGNFIVDKFNSRKNIPHLQTFEGSEHRNVLYIMTNY